jgi:hypothetical protein
MISLMIALSGQYLLVSKNYDGNWTALFRTGDQWPLPPDIPGKVYVFKNSQGYDGQFYHYVAHDPLTLNGLWKYIDDPVTRYSRILIPGLANLIAGGQRTYIDRAYYVIVAISLFLGTFWASQWALFHQQHPAWGLGFLLLPGTVISLWMMNVEIALLALTVAFAYYWRTDHQAGLYMALMLSALCRETGVILTAGFCLWCVLRKSYLKSLAFATALIPAGIWYVYIHTAISNSASIIPIWLMSQPATGMIRAFINPEAYQTAPDILSVIQFLDMLSIMGMIIVFVVTLRWLWVFPKSPITLAAGLHIGLGIVVNNSVFWRIPLGYTRPFSTLFVLLGVQCLTPAPSVKEKWIASAAILVVCLRILLQLVYTEGPGLVH